jgi:chaperone required for assembly of F1-ATPase
MSARVLRRFYQVARTVPVAGGFGVLLDDKPLKSPAKRVLAVSSESLASALAAEWHAQGEAVRPDTLRVTRIVCTALDRIPKRRESVLEELVGYGASDLLCYRAERPESLVGRQAMIWQPMVDWANARYGIALIVTAGIRPITQPTEAVARLRAAAAAQPDLGLAALHQASTTCGSLVIGLMLADGMIGADAAFEAAQLDESYQIEQWGEDQELSERRLIVRAELAAAEQVFRSLHG